MADYRVIDVEQLENGLIMVADSIREKCDTNDPLEFPNGMADAVGGIQTQDTEFGEIYWVESFHGRSIYAYAFYEWKHDKFPFIDTSNGTNFQNTFAYSAITKLPNFNFSKAQMIYRMFNNAKKLKTVTFDFSKVTNNGHEVFRDCSALEILEASNTTNITNFSLWCNGCVSLKSVKTLDFTKATNVSDMFTGCTALEEVEIVTGTIKTSISFADSPLLSSESIQSIIDGLATVTTAQTLTFHKNIEAKLSDEQKAQITSKNWTLAFAS